MFLDGSIGVQDASIGIIKALQSYGEALHTNPKALKIHLEASRMNLEALKINPNALKQNLQAFYTIQKALCVLSYPFFPLSVHYFYVSHCKFHFSPLFIGVVHVMLVTLTRPWPMMRRLSFSTDGLCRFYIWEPKAPLQLSCLNLVYPPWPSKTLEYPLSRSSVIHVHRFR